MRVRAHVDAAAGRELDRTELVEEDERADHAARRRRQHALHREAVAEIAGARQDLVLDEGGGWVIHGSAPLADRLSYYPRPASRARRLRPQA